jgi:hypothetical protein
MRSFDPVEGGNHKRDKKFDGANHKRDKKFDGGNHKRDKKFDGGNHKRDKKFDGGESFGFYNVVCILDFDVVDRGMKFSTQLADDCRSHLSIVSLSK